MADDTAGPGADNGTVQDDTHVVSRNRSSAKLQKEGSSSLKHRLTSILRGILMIYESILETRKETDEDLESKVPAKSTESLKTAPEGEEIDLLFQKIFEYSRKFADQQTDKEKLKLILKSKEEDLIKLRQSLEAAAVEHDTDKNEEIEQLILLEKTRSKELSQHIDKIFAENEDLSRQMEFVKHVLVKSFGHLQAFLDDFIEASFRLPRVKTGSRVHQTLEDFRPQTGQFWAETKRLISFAVEVATDKNAREEQEDSGSVSDEKKTNQKIISNLRKTQETKVQLREHNEEFTKELAEREVVVAGMHREIAQLRRKAADKGNFWADCSLKSTESMRVFVEHFETIGLELFNEKSLKEKEAAELSQEVEGSRHVFQQLRSEVDWLEKQGTVETAAAVEKKREHLQEEKEKLEDIVEKLRESHQKTHEEVEGIMQQSGLKTEEVSQLKSENVKLKLVFEERVKKLEELERKIATYEARSRVTTPARSSSSWLPGSSPPNDPMAHSMPYGGARSLSYSAHGRERMSQSGIERQVSGEGGAEARMRMSQTTSEASQQIMECLKCSIKFPVLKVEDYEKHIRQCYGVSLN